MSILLQNILVDSQNRDVLIQGDAIKEIRPGGTMDPEAHECYDGSNKALLPALVNGHTHSAMTLLRGYGDDMPLFPWLQEKIWPAEACYQEEDFYWGYRLAFLEMIRSGTCYFNDMYFRQDMALQALRDSGLRGMINYVFLNPGDPDIELENQKKCLEWLDSQASGQADIGLAPHSVYTVSPATLGWIGRLSKERNLKVHIHLSETEEENKNCIQSHGKSPTAFLEELGLLSPRLSIAHGLWLSEDDMARLSHHGVALVHNPASNMKLSSGPALNYQALKDRNIPVILGTDGCSSSNNLDMVEHMKLAGLLQKQHYQCPTLLPAKEAFQMASKAGADFWNTQGGEVVCRAKADLMVVNLELPEMQPCHDLISNLVYSGNSSSIDGLLVRGKWLMKDRQVKDYHEILNKAAQRATALVKRAMGGQP